jgi:hypothetical protein
MRCSLEDTTSAANDAPEPLGNASNLGSIEDFCWFFGSSLAIINPFLINFFRQASDIAPFSF